MERGFHHRLPSEGYITHYCSLIFIQGCCCSALGQFQKDHHDHIHPAEILITNNTLFCNIADEMCTSDSLIGSLFHNVDEFMKRIKITLSLLNSPLNRISSYDCKWFRRNYLHMGRFGLFERNCNAHSNGFIRLHERLCNL